MGTRGLEMVCYHGRYYIVYHQYDSDYDFLGAALVARIPEDPEEYQKWLQSMRAQYAAEEQALEDKVYTIRPKTKTKTEVKAEAEDGQTEDIYEDMKWSLFAKYICAPPVMPPIHEWDASLFYIFNLDAEVLTMNFSVHWRMDRIPRADSLWLRSIDAWTHTVDLKMCPESCLASLAVPLPAPEPAVAGTASTMQVRDTRRLQICRARTPLDSHSQAWRALVAASAWASYARQIDRVGRQWYAHDLPFRELAFALVSLAAGRQAAFRSYKPTRATRCSRSGKVTGSTTCHPRNCSIVLCRGDHLPGIWFEQSWFADGDGDGDEEGKAQPPLLDFCSLAHLEGQPPGAAPLETTYWLTDDVLVSLTLVVDGAAVAKAMRWGLEQRRAKSAKSAKSDKTQACFYMVVMSLFNVAFAEVTLPPASTVSDSTVKSTQTTEQEEKERNEQESMPDMLLSTVLPISGLRESLCRSTHPRERSAARSGDRIYNYDMREEASSLTPDIMHRNYPGIVAMVNFFDAIDSRRAAAGGAVVRTDGCLPHELYARILDFVDYATWKDCLLVSPLFRDLGLARYRVDDRYAIVGGPSMKLDEPSMRPGVRNRELKVAFELQDVATGKTETVLRQRGHALLCEHDWVPLIGSGQRQAAMLDVRLAFESVAKRKQIMQELEDELAARQKEHDERIKALAANAASRASG